MESFHIDAIFFARIWVIFDVNNNFQKIKMEKIEFPFKHLEKDGESSAGLSEKSKNM